MITAPYEVQRNLYTYEMQKHGMWEMDTKGNWVLFDESSRRDSNSPRSSGTRSERSHRRSDPFRLAMNDWSLAAYPRLQLKISLRAADLHQHLDAQPC